jgi:glucan 1,3-beta-glucosidase
MRVCLDLHAVPGSQNGYNHSGRCGLILIGADLALTELISRRMGTVNFLNGNMGLANAERTMYYLRVLTEFISQPQYRNLVTIFGIINEPLTSIIGMDPITSFYLEAHDMMRGITGYGEGNGPVSSSSGRLRMTRPDHAWYSILPFMMVSQEPRNGQVSCRARIVL